MSMKNTGDIIGNRKRDLPIFTAVPQPIAPPRTSLLSTVPKTKLRLRVNKDKINTVELPKISPLY
jgi:hypothetical protein